MAARVLLALILSFCLAGVVSAQDGTVDYTGDCSDGCAPGETFDAANPNEIKLEVDQNAADIAALPTLPTTGTADGQAARFDDANGTLQGSGVTIDDSNNVDFPADFQLDGDMTGDGSIDVAGNIEGDGAGRMRGYNFEVSDANYSATREEFRGSMIYFTGTSQTIQLPTTQEGLHACFYDLGATQITLDPPAGGVFVLDGTTLGANDRIQSPATGDGHFLCVMALGDGYLGTWITLGRSGTWTDAGP